MSKRLTKSQYEEIADAIAQVRITNKDYEFVPEETKAEREIMAEQIVAALANNFRFDDKSFNWDEFRNQCRYLRD